MDCTLQNFELTCRTCKTNTGDMHSIDKIATAGLPTPVEMLVACTSLQISPEDGLPRSICAACTLQLESAFTFKDQCEKSDWYFRRLLLRHRVKTEGATTVQSSSSKNYCKLSTHKDHSDIKEETDLIQNATSTFAISPVTTCNQSQSNLHLNEPILPQKRKRGRPRKTERIPIEVKKPTLQSTTPNIMLERDYFKCEQCDLKFSRKAKLTQHLKRHLSQKMETPDSDIDLPNETYTDDLDTANLFSDSYWSDESTKPRAVAPKRIDNKTTNGSLTAKRFKCTLCPKKFTYLNHLKQHFPRHLQEKQQVASFDFLSCNICSEKFIFEDQLQCHIQSHSAAEENKDCLLKLKEDNNLDTGEICAEVGESNMTEGEKIKNKAITCPICFKEFDRLSRLKQHYTAHLPEDEEDVNCKIHKCNDCSRKFIYYFQLKRHMLIHQSVKPFKCESCQKSFLRKDHLTQHIKIHITDTVDSDFHDYNNDPEWTNGFEHLEQNNIEETLLSAADIKTENTALKCHICFKEFPRMNRLKQHYATHLHKENENRFNCTIFKCSVCPKKYTYIYQLKRHMITHQNIKPFKCDDCGKTFARKDHLQQHAKTHSKLKERVTKGRKQDIKCEKCDKRFASEKMMKKHSYRAHEETHVCKTCHATFQGKNELHRHWNRANNCGKRHLCPECGTKFISPSILEIHLRRHRGEKPFKCQYCDKGFTRPSDKITHEIRHRGEKNHVCSICNKGFSKSDVLVRHMRTHTGEKPYKCTYCDAAFSQRNDMNTHVRRHTGERFTCDLCTEEFLVRYLLSKHKRKVHGVDIPPAKPILERVSDTKTGL